MESEIKVLHITTFLGGGAGIATRRLHKSLLDSGVDSKILHLSGRVERSDEQIFQYRLGLKEIILKRAFTILYRWFGLFRYVNEVKGIVGHFDYFSTCNTVFRVENHPLVSEADVIHLHWVADFINFESFFKKLGKKKIVWTLHDMNPFMGGFHYRGDFLANSSLHQLDRAMKEKKSRSFAKSNLHLIYLSEWMFTQVDNKTFKRFNYSIIPNPISFKEFTLKNRANCREKLGIFTDKKIVLFACHSLKNKRKGFDILLSSLDLLKEDVFMLTFGNSGGLELNINFELMNLGSVKSVEEMNIIYSAADVLVLPSLEDNLPNVMLEAWVSGLPVVSFDNGGMRDYVISGFNGEITTLDKSDKIADVVMDALRKEYSPMEIREWAYKQFAPEFVSKKFIEEVYNEI